MYSASRNGNNTQQRNQLQAIIKTIKQGELHRARSSVSIKLEFSFSGRTCEMEIAEVNKTHAHKHCECIQAAYTEVGTKDDKKREMRDQRNAVEYRDRHLHILAFGGPCTSISTWMCQQMCGLDQCLLKEERVGGP
jgi:hypothetical protein